MKVLNFVQLKLLRILSMAILLISCTFFCIAANAENDEFSLNPLATVLVTEGEFSEIKQNELLFTNRTHKFSENVPDYLLNKSFLFKDLSGVNVTVKTSGWIYVLTETEGSSSQASALLEQGYEQIQ